MRLDAASWQKVLAALPDIAPRVGSGVGAGATVAFVSSEEFVSKSGSVWLWRPGTASRRPESHAYTGSTAQDWGMLLVVSGLALDTLCAEGDTCIGALVRRGEIRPFLLRDAATLEAAGLADFIESLGLAFPRH
ncbi:MAG: hypothetical protein IPI44_01285 [Sulfuritalea sp.]|nr:hypothetical protein [Sulfuritalea sp.]